MPSHQRRLHFSLGTISRQRTSWKLALSIFFGGGLIIIFFFFICESPRLMILIGRCFGMGVKGKGEGG